MSGEFLGDDTIEKQYGNWKAPESEKTPPEQKELKDPSEIENIADRFSENQLIIEDGMIETAIQILKNNGVRFKAERYIESAPVTDSNGQEVERVPGEYVISISDSEEARPADPEFTIQVAEILKKAGVDYVRGRKAA